MPVIGLIKFRKGAVVNFRALTMIEPVTNLLEIVLLPSQATAAMVARLFENTWLARYPRPNNIVTDRGTEFLGHEFTDKLWKFGIGRHKRTTAYNPQSNGIIERSHQITGQIFRTLMILHEPMNKEDVLPFMEDAIATAIHAQRSAAQSNIGCASPGSLAFGRDMILNIPYVADLVAIQKLRQQQVDERLIGANAQRISHDWRVNEEVWVKADPSRSKILPKCDGPYPITKVHTNGTVSVLLKPNKEDRINVRRLKLKVD